MMKYGLRIITSFFLISSLFLSPAWAVKKKAKAKAKAEAQTAPIPAAALPVAQTQHLPAAAQVVPAAVAHPVAEQGAEPTPVIQLNHGGITWTARADMWTPERLSQVLTAIENRNFADFMALNPTEELFLVSGQKESRNGISLLDHAIALGNTDIAYALIAAFTTYQAIGHTDSFRNNILHTAYRVNNQNVILFLRRMYPGLVRFLDQLNANFESPYSVGEKYKQLQMGLAFLTRIGQPKSCPPNIQIKKPAARAQTQVSQIPQTEQDPELSPENILERLPSELQVMVLSHLDRGSLLSLRRVSRRTRALADVVLAKRPLVISFRPENQGHTTFLFDRIRQNIQLYRQIPSVSIQQEPSLKLPHLQFILEHFSKLIHLDINFSTVSDEIAPLLARHLRQNKPLKSLTLRASDLTPTGFRHLVNALPENRTLLNLNFGDTRMLSGRRSMEELARALRENDTLEELHLDNTGLSFDGLIALSEGLGEESSLQRLDISRNPITTGIVQLSHALERNTSLQRLNLSNTHLDDLGAERILAMLDRNHTLLEINLNENTLRPELLNAILARLKENQKLFEEKQKEPVRRKKNSI